MTWLRSRARGSGHGWDVGDGATFRSWEASGLTTDAIAVNNEV